MAEYGILNGQYMKKEKVVVGFSGGKDSTTAILKLKEKNFQVEALTMKLGIANEDEKLERIKHLAHLLDVPWRMVDLAEVFRSRVVNYFLTAYADGLTPNPCVICNIEIKFKLLLREALVNNNADWFATGHYAAIRKSAGRIFLTEPLERTKSQIYFLSMVGAKSLARVVFPLAQTTLSQVKNTVKDLPLGNPRESQDVCFLGDVSLIDYLKQQVPEKFKPGKIIDIEGKEIGSHRGAIYFTIGQRRGTGFASDRKLYVINKNLRENTITLAEEKYLFSDKLHISNPVFWRQIKVGEVLSVRIRYVTALVEAEITEVSSQGMKAKFNRPVSAVSPGQIAAFYEGDHIVAGGFITR